MVKADRGQLLRPGRLGPGACVAVYTPSYPGPGIHPERFQRGVAALRRAGFEVLVPPAALEVDGYTSGTAEHRGRELTSLFRDSRVDGIVTTLGGHNSNAVLPWLDYEIIRSHPKVFCGYSDTTALLLGIHARTNLVTFHGPAVLPEWGEFPDPYQYTVDLFLAVVGGAILPYQPPEAWTNERQEWSQGEDCRPRKLTRHDGWIALRAGAARGPLLGGNIAALTGIVGTPYWPSFAGAILFLEATGPDAELPCLERSLSHLELAGVFSSASALLFGRCPDARPLRGTSLRELLKVFSDRWKLPTAINVDFGHTDPKLTLPIGCTAEVACGDFGVRFRLRSSAVRS